MKGKKVGMLKKKQKKLVECKKVSSISIKLKASRYLTNSRRDFIAPYKTSFMTGLKCGHCVFKKSLSTLFKIFQVSRLAKCGNVQAWRALGQSENGFETFSGAFDMDLTLGAYFWLLSWPTRRWLATAARKHNLTTQSRADQQYYMQLEFNSCYRDLGLGLESVCKLNKSEMDYAPERLNGVLYMKWRLNCLGRIAKIERNRKE